MRPSADGRDTRNARGRATVRSIEREAVRLAQLHGSAALTVDQICEAVGITQRSFFNHFDTKDDALLGWELPRLSEQRTREYLADPQVGILSGALGLVELPSELTEDPDLVHARFRLIADSPWLIERQIGRLRPLAADVAEIVELKLRSVAGPDADAQQLRSAAATITAMAASLTIRPPLGEPEIGMAGVGVAPVENAGTPLPDPAAASSGLEQLRWIWDRLI
ncbi:TetR/AcrR family transcriptional regulator [Galbitalea soli]|uniref:TetR/AcrR family transcriptional regulator n=1 Tax=Galbitalea soli TaxID=1268042 RepID=A0A7C9PNX8_9MICO|nr:TetR/AcrR family transcriptional regulator [Galbitalea soli]NEM91974.1 TetR/AcrR family transcriptional regulator [Galbitalea soli]NYJ32076.1 AcrR family transcriptional regulator [Galbitalea soli]